MFKLASMLYDDQLDAIDGIGQRLPRGDDEEAPLVYAKAFRDLETGEMFFLRMHGMKGSTTKRPTAKRPSRFLGDALVSETLLKGWGALGFALGDERAILLPYPTEAQL